MKAITIWQPWAQLIAIGAKKYETRSWATNYRGPIAIHAAKRPFNTDPFFDRELNQFKEALNIPDIYSFDSLPLGCIIATVRLVRCSKIEVEPDGTPYFRYWPNAAEILQLQKDFPGQRDYRGQRIRRFPEAERKELLFGDWAPGRYAWELTNVTMLPEPIPAKGKQGLWSWDMPEI